MNDDPIYHINSQTFEDSDLFSGYAYNIPKHKITKALKMLTNQTIHDLVKSEINADWQDADLLANDSTIPEDMKHHLRIAMLIILIKNGTNIKPVEIDTFSHSPSCLEGHHRLLALKYLKYKDFPAVLSGNIDVLESNLNVNMSL